MPLTLANLKSGGFKRTGFWVLNEKARPELNGGFPGESGIYLFAVNGEVKYIGKSNVIRNRLSQYGKSFQRHWPGTGPRDVDRGIKVALDAGDEVIVYTLIVTTRRFVSRRGGLPFDDLVGLEAGLIENLSPVWNRGKASPLGPERLA
jgi:hypothetical protein